VKELDEEINKLRDKMKKNTENKEIQTDHDKEFVDKVIEKFNKHFRYSDYQIYREIKEYKFKEEGVTKASFL